MRKAEGLFKRALRLQSQPEKEENLPAALNALEESRDLNPYDVTYANTYEFVKQQLVSKHLEQGNLYLEQNRQIEAIGEFREALNLDPTNAFAQQRLNDAISGTSLHPQPPKPVQVITYASEPVLKPKPGKVKFDYRGDSRNLFAAIGKAFGILVEFDGGVTSRTIRFQLEESDFYTAIYAARQVTGTFYMVMAENQILVATDNQETRRRLEHMSLQTFVLPNSTSSQDLQDVANLIKTILDVRFVTTNLVSSSLTVRAPVATLDAVAKLVNDLNSARPEVLLEIHAFQINRNKSRNIGISIPTQFTIFNLATEARTLLNQPGSQSLINQLISSGTITAADAAAVAAALAATTGSPLLMPFATFGGGIFKSGVGIPAITPKLDYSESSLSSIQHMTLRASQGQAAIFRVGDRIPVLTSQYSPLISVPGLQQAQQNNSLNQPIPSFNYEELGITLKATPRVSGDLDVTMQLELQIKALAGQSFNGVPTISNREYTGTVTMQDGKPSILAGSINHQEQKSVQGLPWLSRIPLLTYAVSTHSSQDSTTELLFVITPHVLRGPKQKSEATETYLEGK